MTVVLNYGQALEEVSPSKTIFLELCLVLWFRIGIKAMYANFLMEASNKISVTIHWNAQFITMFQFGPPLSRTFYHRTSMKQPFNKALDFCRNQIRKHFRMALLLRSFRLKLGDYQQGGISATWFAFKLVQQETDQKEKLFFFQEKFK